MIRFTTMLLASKTLASSSAFVPTAFVPTSQRPGYHQSLAAAKKPKEEDKSFLDKTFGFFQDDEAAKKKKKTEAMSLKSMFGIKDEKRREQSPFDKFSSVTSSDDDRKVDEKLLNRLRVHAEKILEADDRALELLGGGPVAMGNIIFSNPAAVVVGGGRKTEGIRARIEVKGGMQSGTALVVGDRRGVLMLKLTVGRQTIDVRAEEGLDVDVAHGVHEKPKEGSPFERHRAAAKAARKDDKFSSMTSSVDEKLLNRLRVHAEKILEADDDALKLLGGGPVAMGDIIFSNPAVIVVYGDRKTDGIRARIEVRGGKQRGTALIVGDRRGVLMLKLTVGGQTIDVRMEEGLDVDVAHGVKRLRP